MSATEIHAARKFLQAHNSLSQSLIRFTPGFHQWQIVFAIVMSMLAGASMAAQPWLLGKLYDGFNRIRAGVVGLDEFWSYGLCALLVASAVWIAWDQALVTLATTPLIMVVLRWVSRNDSATITSQSRALAKMQAIVVEVVQHIEHVKCYAAEAYELDRFHQSIRHSAEPNQGLAKTTAAQMGLLTLLSTLMFVQSFYYGCFLVARGTRSPGDVVTCFFSTLSALRVGQELLSQRVVLDKASLAANRLLRLSHKDIDNQLGSIAVLPSCGGSLVMERIHFAYPSRVSQAALDGVDLRIPAGAHLFLIGRSGSGKSTIGQLLAGLYDPREGAVCLDGILLQDLRGSDIRSSVLLVEQQTTLINDTLLNNITAGIERSCIDERAVSAAVAFAGLQSMIDSLPAGLKTGLHRGGSKLSPGQQQRLAIARARLRDPPILILDECTSALDLASRNQMMDDIRRWRRGRTTIIITHDLSQIRNDDIVAVIDQGRLTRPGQWNEMKADMPKTVTEAVGTGHSEAPVEDDSAERGNRVFSRRTPERNDWASADEDAYSSCAKPSSETTSRSSMQATSQSMVMILRTVWPCLTRQARLSLLIGWWAATIHALASPAFSLILAKLLATYGDHGGSSKSTTVYASRLLLIAMVDSLHVFAARLFLELVGQRWVDAIRGKTFKQIMEQRMRFFDIHGRSRPEISRCLTYEAEVMRGLIGQTLSPLYIAAVLGIVSLGLAVWMQVTMTLAALATLLLMACIGSSVSRIKQEIEASRHAPLQAARDVFAEAFAVISTVRTLNLEPYFELKHFRASQASYVTDCRQLSLTSTLFGLSESLVHFAVAFVFGTGAWLTYHGAPPDDILKVLTILVFGIVNVSSIMESLAPVATAMGAASRLLCWWRSTKASHLTPADASDTVTGDISFDHYSFAYPHGSGHTTLQNLDLTIVAGSCVAIGGASGCGKSTLARTLLGLYGVDAVDGCRGGDLTIGSSRLSQVVRDRQAFRSSVVAALQTPFIAAGSVLDNITYGLPKDSALRAMALVKAAATQAGAHQDHRHRATAVPPQLLAARCPVDRRSASPSLARCCDGRVSSSLTRSRRHWMWRLHEQCVKRSSRCGGTAVAR